MKPFCEIVAMEILPAVRAMVARELTQKYGIGQKRAAALLGVSQPAVSQYKRDLRGYRSGIFRKNPGLGVMAKRIAEGMASGEISGLQSTLSFCELCKEIRFSGAGCDACRAKDPSLGQCSVCADNEDFYGKKKTKSIRGRIKVLSKF